ASSYINAYIYSSKNFSALNKVIMKMAEVDLVPIVGTISVFTWLTIIVVYGTYTEHKEKMRKMDLIEKGLWKPEYEPKVKPEGALLAGLIIAGIGVAILAGSFWVIWDIGQWLRLGGLIILLIGIALITYYATIKRTTVQR
ncbi:MAG: DUF6249 domain-containing protein, partial [Nitrososphaerales archaeon]